MGYTNIATAESATSFDDLATGPFGTGFICLYGSLFSGLFYLLLLVTGRFDLFDGFSDKAALMLGCGGLYLSFIKGRTRVNLLSGILLAYISYRAIILAGFATTNNYSVFNYLFPLKNWLGLLLFFVIGQSITLPLSRVNDLLLRIFTITATCLIMVQLYLTFSGAELVGVDSSRIPLLRYRIGMDILLMIYTLIVATTRYLRGSCSGKSYLLYGILMSAVLLSSQTKQIALSAGVVMLYFSLAGTATIAGRRNQVRIVTLLFLGTIILATPSLYSSSLGDSYFSYLKRVELIEYVRDKVAQHPVTGYPIPSNIGGGDIPKDIKYAFFSGSRSELIYPSDLPLLGVLMEEGFPGLLFIYLFLYCCYRYNRNVRYLLLLTISTVLTFRMYYLLALGSSMTYFLLGLYTRESNQKEDI